jgi:hypothetical protein
VEVALWDKFNAFSISGEVRGLSDKTKRPKIAPSTLLNPIFFKKFSKIGIYFNSSSDKMFFSISDILYI